jgi:Domain of unknown function (DUF4845)
MNTQRGMGFAGVLAMLVGIVILAILGMKLVPAYLEYFNIKKAVTAITSSGELRNATVADVRKAFELRQAIDDFTSVGPKDIEITKDGNEVVVSFAYERRIPLFSNVSVVIDFAGSSKPSSIKGAD